MWDQDKRENQFSLLMTGKRSLIFHIINKYSFIREHEKEDYYQEAVAYLWKVFDRFDITKGAFSVWMYRNAEWAIFKYRRKQRWHSESVKYSADLVSWYDFADDITTDFYDESNLEILRKAISSLSPHRQKVVQMFMDGENLKQKSLSDGKSATAYSSTLSDIRKQILRMFGSQFETIIPDVRKTITVSNGRFNEVHPGSRNIEMRGLDGCFIKSFPSANEAGRHGFNPSMVVAVCRGKRYSYKGYKWNYTGELVARAKQESGRAKKPVVQKTSEGAIVRHYKSLKECKLAGFNPDSITKNLTGKTKEYRGFKWEYTLNN